MITILFIVSFQSTTTYTNSLNTNKTKLLGKWNNLLL